MYVVQVMYNANRLNILQFKFFLLFYSPNDFVQNSFIPTNSSYFACFLLIQHEYNDCG